MIWDAITGIVDKGLGLVDKFVEDKDKANELKSQIKSQMMEQLHNETQALIEGRSKALLAEIQGKSWMQRNWRPVLMFVIIGIIANNFVIYPYLSLFTDKVTVLTLPRELYELMFIGVGGYVLGRSGEKIWGKKE